MSERPDFLGNPNLIELAAETLDPPMWLAMALIKDTAANPPKTQGEAIDRIVALCKHAIAMATDLQAESQPATGGAVIHLADHDVIVRVVPRQPEVQA